MSNKTIEMIQEIVRGKEELARTREQELICKLESYMQTTERKFSIV